MFFLDCLYGEIDVPLEDNVLILPELQRLREIRLCNINSPFLTGGANINRFEHAIGTLYLANEYSKIYGISGNEKSIFLLSALLHDVITPSFGHSLEYIFNAFGFEHYEHANFETLLCGKTVMRDRPFFIGKKSAIRKELVQSEISEEVLHFINGEHRLSPILEAEIDIDNIDNVFRFAYHLGLQVDKGIPQKLASSLFYEDSILTISQKDICLYDEWFEIRKKLYKYLLENPGEFVAKALLERVFIDLISNKMLDNSDWIKTDLELVDFVIHGDAVPKKTKEIMQNLMTMKFPKYRLILRTNSLEEMFEFMPRRVDFIEWCYKEYGVFFHVISDINKTCRQLHIKALETGQEVQVGDKDDRYLIGIFGESQIHFDKIISQLQSEFNIKTSEVYVSAPTQLSLF